MNKYEVVSKLIATFEGRKRLAASMIQPLRTRRDYRKIHGQPIPIDAVFVCEKCGSWSDQEDYVHDPNECIVAEVLRS